MMLSFGSGGTVTRPDARDHRLARWDAYGYGKANVCSVNSMNERWQRDRLDDAAVLSHYIKGSWSRISS